MTMEIFVPNWYAEKIRERYRSLGAYEQQWGNSVKIIDAYWHELARESMERLNRHVRK